MTIYNSYILNSEYEWAVSMLPRPDESVLAIAPPEEGPGHWVGAPSAVLGDDGIYLAYRLRRPVGDGRGYAVTVARSDDGVSFEPLLTVTREQFGAESLERPSLVRSPAGRWRLYVSCATPGSKHWRVELLEGEHPARFDPAGRVVVLPGDAKTGVKDPVIRHRGGQWQLWASCHPLADPDEADQMVTEYATSADGLEWTWHGTALAGRPGEWDARGTRVASVCDVGSSLVAFYDGRASAAENYEERTGIAVGTDPAALTGLGTAPAAQSRYPGHGLRYLDVLPLGNGRHRIYYEMTRPDGSHDLRTEER
ncbi:MAG TPA: hypothetical protein VH641_08795 [Streptosporangiaceae bacterium]